MNPTEIGRKGLRVDEAYPEISVGAGLPTNGRCGICVSDVRVPGTDHRVGRQHGISSCVQAQAAIGTGGHIPIKL